MAETTLQLGFVPKNRDEYQSTPVTRYYKDNVVQYNGSSYIADPVGWSEDDPTATYVTVPPTDESGNLNAGWRIFASGNNTFTTGEKVENVGIDTEPTAGSDNLVKSGGVAEKVKNIKEQKLDKEINDDSFYVTDSDNNIVLKIDSNGVHSVDYTYKNLEDSLADESGNVSIIAKFASVLQSILSESTQRQEADNTQMGLIEQKLDKVIESNKFFVTDNQGYKIFQIDAEGIHGTNLILHNNNLKITDANGYIVLSIGSDGIIHTIKDKHAVACMVLSESYYPIETPVRDSNGNVISANVMFETGVEGNLSITYTNENATSVAVVYGNYNYTISINRDNNGNVDNVSIN